MASGCVQCSVCVASISLGGALNDVISGHGVFKSY